MNEKLDLTNIRVIKSILAEHGIRLRKELGQNFLVDRKVLDKILEAAELDVQDEVVEIGTGIGVLTQELCERVGKVIAYELDERLAEIVKAAVGKSHDNLQLVVGDFLDEQLKVEGRYKVVANLPYQITTPVIRRFLEREKPPERMVFLLQKEVAERLAGMPGNRNRGWVSVLVQLFGKPRVEAIVPASSFFPSPAVDSAILSIKEIDKPQAEDLKGLLRVVKAGFSAKRRQLPNSIAGGLGIDVEVARDAIRRVDIEPVRRAETLTNEEWIKLAIELRNIEQ